MSSYSIKRGDTFAMQCAMTDANDDPQDLTDWLIKSQVRSSAGNLLSELTVSNRDDAAGTFVVSASSTAGWPVGTVNWDIQYTDDSGNIRSTQTVQIPVVADVTY